MNGQEITVTLTFRVNDETRLRELATAVLQESPFFGLDDERPMEDYALEECAEIVITDRVGPYFNIGLERLGD